MDEKKHKFELAGLGVAPFHFLRHYTVERCMAVMTDQRVRHLPVLDGGELIGIVSIGDLVKSIIGDQKFVIDQLEHYIHG